MRRGRRGSTGGRASRSWRPGPPPRRRWRRDRRSHPPGRRWRPGSPCRARQAARRIRRCGSRGRVPRLGRRPAGRQGSPPGRAPAAPGRWPAPWPCPRPPAERWTHQGNGYPPPGAPSARACGTGSGSSGPRRGSHTRSLARGTVDRGVHGMRTTMSAPRRKRALSAPRGRTGTTASAAQAGNCAATSRRTKSGSMSTSSACMCGGAPPPGSQPSPGPAANHPSGRVRSRRAGRPRTPVAGGRAADPAIRARRG